MIEVREVLRRHVAGQGLRQIARETGLDRKTVRRYVEAASEAGLTSEETLDEERVRAALLGVQQRPVPAPSEQRQELAPHVKALRGWLLEDKLRLTKVQQLLRGRGVDVGYATLRRFAIDELGWRKPASSVRLEEREPGEEAQVDFALMGTVRDEASGRERKLWVLLVVLSFSRHMFVWPTFEQTTEALIAGLDAAFRFFGGVPKRVVIDNTKAAVVSADRTSPRLQESFAEYAQTRGFFVDPARVRKPRDKARVENQVEFVRHGWFAGERFLGLRDAREDAARWCLEVAGTRVHGTTRKVPREVFETVERVCLLPAPLDPFDTPEWSDAKVHADHHVKAHRALYSVPTRYVGRVVRVRSDRTTVRIYLGAELIKMHARQPAGGRSTDPHDYPSGKADYAFRNVEALVTRAQKHGAHVGLLAERLLAIELPWTKMRQGYQLLRLCERYGDDRVDALCKRALDFDVVDVPRIERMLKKSQRSEDEAEQRGELRKLSSSPRFAREQRAFVTRDADPEGGSR